MKSAKALAAWLAAHQHRVLVLLGVLAECASEFGKLYGGPPWLASGHLAFVALVSLGVITMPAKSRVEALEAMLEALSKSAADAKPAALPPAAKADDDDPYADVPTTDAKN